MTGTRRIDMRILYIDIDTLRPDHLGCYGYHRNTSPNIDKIAAKGVRFDNCYVSDSPCLPSRAALYSGKCGIRNRAINHGGKAADLYIDPKERGFSTLQDNYIMQLRKAGYYTVSVSPFGERHSSFWFYNGFREIYNTGKCGSERAEEVVPTALDWLDRRGKDDNWYLHVNLWDPHTPYRVPDSQGNPFEKDPPPAWMTEKIRKKTWDTYGPGCAREPSGDFLYKRYNADYKRMPLEIDSMDAYKKWIDGYDTGIWYADKHVGVIIEKLQKLKILDDTMIMISSDHGENQGELAVYGDHQTGDHITNRVPMIIYHPKGIGGKGRADKAIHYQFDVAATVLEMAGRKVPASWDGRSFLPAFKKEREQGRESIVVSNCAWSCQRSARWDDYIMIRTYHSGFKNYPENMLFNLKDDPHELNNLADKHPELVKKGLAIIEKWTAEEMALSHPDEDPLQTVLREGGPYHASYSSPAFGQYLQRLRATGRGKSADELEKRKDKHDQLMRLHKV